MEREESVERAAKAWAELEQGDIDAAVAMVGRWVPVDDGADVPDADICLAQAHIALAEGAYGDALDAAIAALSALGERASDEADEDAATLTRSFQRVILEAGNGAAGLAGKQFAVFSSPDDCKRAGGTYSGLSTRLYLTRPIAVDAKAPLVTHFARCAVVCDGTLVDMTRKRGSIRDRLRNRRKDAEKISPAGPQALPTLDIEDPGREDMWCKLVDQEQ